MGRWDDEHCPTIVNLTEHTCCVFLSRGIFYSKAVLEPGEAFSIKRRQTGGRITPYRIHACVGDERCLPTTKQSLQNMVSVAAIPTAFLVGAFCTAASAGTLSGPSAALVPMVNGLVVKGVVIDSASIAAGALVADRAVMVSEMLVKKHPQQFMTKTPRLFPGKRYMTLTGGVDKPLKLTRIRQRKFRRLQITEFKQSIKQSKKEGKQG